MLSSVSQQHNASSRRFHLLLLEEKEYYFEDYGGFVHLPPPSEPPRVSSRGRAAAAAVSTPMSARKSIKGRLLICSRSLVFDPDDARYPLIRLSFRDMVSMRRRAIDRSEFIVVLARLVAEIAPLQPYEFKKLDVTQASAEYGFSLSYVGLGRLMPLIEKLHHIEHLDDLARRAHELRMVISARENAIAFDSSWYVDLHEKPLLEPAVLASQITPLLVNSGRLMITDVRIYFQPFNNAAVERVQRFDIANIQRMYKRRNLMRNIGIELFFKSTKVVTPSHGTTTCPESVYFTFDTPLTRDTLFRLLETQPNYAPVHEFSLESMTYKWVTGACSNYDYLMFLNQQAGRSFNDLTQYPVFPWVLADYTSEHLDFSNSATFRDLSKPIGALNSARLRNFKERMQHMPSEICHGLPFLYGTHYSTPGYVLYFLVRKAPEYMLCLHNGRFDVADRSFASVAHAWHIVNSASDVKELIPEFYCLDGTPGEFLTNQHHLQLGVTQDGKRVSDVDLPRWCGSPADFVTHCRSALECDYVSKRLHNWIDLIFGFKQRGEEAKKADNLFYYLTYEGAVDLDSMESQSERESVMTQISEFGQTPMQIFAKPHPQKGSPIQRPLEAKARLASSSSSSASARDQSSSSSTSSSSLTSLASPPTGSASNAARTPFSLSRMSANADGSSEAGGVATVAAWPTLVSRDRTESVDVALRALEGQLSPVTDAKSGTGDLNALAQELGAIEVKQLEMSPSAPKSPARHTKWKRFRKLECIQRLSVHRDAVTATQLSPDGNTLYSVSADHTFKIFSLETGKQKRSTSVGNLTLSSLELTSDGRNIVMGSWDNNIYWYSLAYGNVLGNVQAHDDAVSCLSIQGDRLISGGWDATVKCWQVRESELSKSPLLELIDHEAQIERVAISADARTCASAAADGVIMLWDLRSKQQIHAIEDAHSMSITGLSFVGITQHVMSCSTEGCVKEFNGNGREVVCCEMPDKPTCLRTDGSQVLVGGEAGTLSALTYARAPAGSRRANEASPWSLTVAAADRKAGDDDWVEEIDASEHCKLVVGMPAEEAPTCPGSSDGESGGGGSSRSVTVRCLAATIDGSRVVAGLDRSATGIGSVIVWDRPH